MREKKRRREAGEKRISRHLPRMGRCAGSGAIDVLELPPGPRQDPTLAYTEEKHQLNDNAAESEPLRNCLSTCLVSSNGATKLWCYSTGTSCVSERPKCFAMDCRFGKSFGKSTKSLFIRIFLFYILNIAFRCNDCLWSDEMITMLLYQLFNYINYIMLTLVIYHRSINRFYTASVYWL